LAAQDGSPRVRVAAVLPQEGGLLLVRHVKDGRSYHLLPGGGVEAGESIADALIREVREETGISCRPIAPLFINDSIDPDGSRHVIQLTFLAEATGDAPAARPVDPRVAGTDVVPVDSLHTLDLRPPLADDLVRAAAEGFAAPARYLGGLWSPDAGITGTGDPPKTDG
jgi:8-oxo-dGTP diphosphatase